VIARIRLSALLSILGAGAMLVPGCSWTTFDDLKDEVWVDVSGGPGSPGTTFGIALASVAPSTTGDSTRFAALGRNKPTLTRVSFDANGKRTEVLANDLAETFSIQAFSISPAFGGDPTGTMVAYAGLTNNGDTQMVAYDIDNLAVTRSLTVLNQPPETVPLESEGLAFGAAGGDALADIAFSTRESLFLVADPGAADTNLAARSHRCVHGGDWSYGVAIGDFLSTSDGAEIAVSIGSQQRSLDGAAVKLVAVSDITQYDTVTKTDCGAVAALPGIEKPAIHDFGEEVLAADFDGDGRSELVVSAPSVNQVFLYREDPAAPGTLIERVFTGPGNGFGVSLAVGDLDGDGKPELVVGAPRANAEDVRNAGAVYVFAYNTATAAFDETPLLTVHDAYPETEQGFGSQVALSAWRIDAVPPAPAEVRNVLVVAGKDEVFTYFKEPLLEDDVRAGR
jgi:hypothetical protein